MYKAISIILLVCSCFSLMALQDTSSAYTFKQKSKNSIYQSTLECEAKLTIASFQKCHFKLLKDDKAVKDIEIFLSGGMPAHQHGLPTAPKIIWSEDNQAYLIKGLKFSMPGKWILNFKVNAVDASEKDIISMEINVN